MVYAQRARNSKHVALSFILQMENKAICTVLKSPIPKRFYTFYERRLLIYFAYTPLNIYNGTVLSRFKINNRRLDTISPCKFWLCLENSKG